MSTLDPSRHPPPPAFDQLVQCMHRIALPSVDNSRVPEAVLPAFLKMREQFTDQHARTLKDIASMRLAWSCLSTFEPPGPPGPPSDAAPLPACADSSVVPPIQASASVALAKHNAGANSPGHTVRAKLRDDAQHRPLTNKSAPSPPTSATTSDLSPTVAHNALPDGAPRSLRRAGTARL